MRNRLLCGTAIGLALTMTLNGATTRGALAACDPATAGDDAITCVPFIPDGALISGLDGNDTITIDGAVVGQSGPNTTITGATGNDTITGTNGSQLGQGFSGIGVILGESGSDLLGWNGGSIGGATGPNIIDGGSGGDTLTLGGGVVVDLAHLLGGLGGDTFLFGDALIADTDQVTVDGGEAADDFRLTGTVLAGRTGSEGTVAGGDGDDTFGLVGAIVGDQGLGIVDAGTGNDTLSFTNGTTVGQQPTSPGNGGVVLGGEGADLFLFDDPVFDTTFNVIGDGGSGTVDMGSGSDTLITSGQALVIGRLGEADGTLAGGDGDDSIYGSMVIGNFGDGTLLGGSGADRVELDVLTMGAAVNLGGTQSEGVMLLGEGADLLLVQGQATIGQNGNATIAAGDGDDTLDFTNDPGLAIFISGGLNSEATLDTGTGDDTVRFLGVVAIGGISDGTQTTLSLGTGNDSFRIESNTGFNSGIGANTGSNALLLGGSGVDTLQFLGAGVSAGGGGATTVDAGAGDDTFYMTSNALVEARINAGTGSQALVTGGGGGDSLVLSDAQVASSGTGTLDGGDGDDLVRVEDNSQIGTFAGSAGLVRGGEGTDTLTVTNSTIGNLGQGTLSGDSGGDTLILTDALVGQGGTGSGSLLGGQGSDTLYLDDTDVGVNGDGMLDGSDDADLITLVNGTRLGVNTSSATASLFGGGGDDTVDATASTFAVNGSATYDGGDGNDTLSLVSGTAADGTTSQASLFGGSGLDIFSFDASSVANRGRVELDGGDGGDSLLFANASQVAVTGSASATMRGGAGDDTLDVNASTFGVAGRVTVDLGADADLTNLVDMTAAEEVSAEVSLFSGLGNDTLSASNSILARSGGLVIDQGDGADSLYLSNFTRVALNGGSEATLSSGSGNDLLDVNGSNLAESGLALVDLGAGADRAVFFGASLAGQLSGVLRLAAGDGDDTLDVTSSFVAVNGQASIGGGSGNDTLTFSNARFALQVGSGATLFGEDGDDRVELVGSTFGDFGQALGFGGSGADTLVARGSSVLADNGTASFFGGAGDDLTTLDFAVLGDGAAGLLSGEAGNDVYLLQNQASLGRGAAGIGLIEGGAGNDSFGLTDSDVGVAGRGSIAGGSGSDRFTAAGGSGLGIDAGASGSLLGGSGSDSFLFAALLVGDFGAGLVDGGAGNDSFDLGMSASFGQAAGGSGTLLGGLGDDSLTANGAAVGVNGSGTLAGGSGADSFDFAGTAIGSGAGSGAVTGDSGSDLLTFRSGATIGGGAATGFVDGGLGNDSLTLDASNLGGSGAGTLTGGEGDDTVLVRNGAGVGTLAGTGTLLGGSGSDSVTFQGSTLGDNGRFLGEAGDDTLSFGQASSIAAAAQTDSGAGNDRLRLEDTTIIAATAAFEGGADSDTLELFGSGVGTFAGNGVFTSFENLHKTGTGTWNWDRAGVVFNSILLSGGTFTLLNETLGGNTTIQAAATLTGDGTLVGNLSNAGVIVPGTDGSFGVLRIEGDYSGGGLLALDVMLGADGSPADLLQITGATSGSTTVAVTNLGGLGAESVGLGILVIEVGTLGGSSAGGHFTLGGPVTVGMFEYGLVLQDDGNWYLTTNFLDETVDLTLGGSAAIAGWYAGLRSVDERLGELRQLVGPTLEPGQAASLGGTDLALRESVVERPLSGWLRVGGAFDDYGSAVGAPFAQTTVAVQGGFDGGFRGLLTGGDLLLAGVFATMTQARAEVHGTATTLDLEGWGGGLYASYLWQGLYVDAVLKADAFDLDYSLPAIEAEASQDALALGASLEVGWRFELGGGTFLEPQGQLSYLKVELSDLDDLQDDQDVIFEDAQSLRGRIGLRLGATLDVGGTAVRPYAEVSGLREFLGESEATIGDNVFTSELQGNAVELGLGLSVTDKTGHLSLFLDGDYVQADVGSSVQVQGGIRLSW
jgi:outer membrane autotransporter protein